jgi:drug/metabolite transporter (DMT)-like permease
VDAPVTSSSKRPLLGIFLVCMASTLFPVMIGLVQQLSPRYGAVQLVWARQFFHLLFLVVAFGARFGRAVLRTTQLKWQLLRSATLLISVLLLYVGVQRVPLAKSTSINLTAPLFVALLAGPLLGERLSKPRALAVLVGLSGALLIIRPTEAVFQPASLLIVGASLFYALFQILTRFVGRYDLPQTSAVYSVLVGTVALSLYVPVAWNPIQSVVDAALMFSLGILGGLGHYCLARALVLAPVNLAAPFVYWQLVAAIVVGYVVSGELPDRGTSVGALVVVAAGLFLGWVEARGEAPRVGLQRG